MSIGWEHPRDDADQWDGHNQSGIEHFRTNPIGSLSREIVQNSLDARLDIHKPVVVKFRVIKVPTDSIPNIDELKGNIELCKQSAQIEGEKAANFYERASNLLSQKNVIVLEVSDFNTLGIKGPATNGTPYFAFIKAEGQSIKSDPAATGSYGIGKHAPYAVSLVRTVFVSTVYEDDSGEYQQLTQGKSILMSHDVEETRRRGTGFWGVKKKCKPFESVSDTLPDWLQRCSSESDLSSKIGTKILIICFDQTGNWQEYIASSIAENFFGAIMAGDLLVDIDNGKYSLKKTTIEPFFANSNVRDVIKELKDEPAKFDDCASYLRTFGDSMEIIKEESQQSLLGLCEVRILVGERLPKKVCALRNGMYITSSMSGLKMFSDFKEFVAVFRCLNPDGNRLLRAMEPPRHDEFEPNLLSDKKEQQKGRRALNDLAKWIRDMLKRHAKDPVADVTTLDELKDMFGEEGDGETGKGQEINPFGKVLIRAKPLKVSVKSTALPGDDSGDGSGGGTGSGEGGEGSDGGEVSGGAGEASGGAGGGSSVQKGTMSELENVRSISLSKVRRKLIFTPRVIGKLRITVMESGADADYPVALSSSSEGEIVAGKLDLNVEDGVRVSLVVDFSEEFTGAVKVIANEI